MRTKRLPITLLVLILATATVGASYLFVTNKKPYTTTSTPSTPTVSVTPERTIYPADIGETFAINITITNATDLYCWQTGLNFNATVLECLSLTEGPLLKQKGNTLWMNATINNTAGKIHYHAAALTGNVTGVNGNGPLGTITFKVKDYGNSNLQLTEVILLDSQLTSIDKTLIHGIVQVRIPGDVNGDQIVGVLDLTSLGKAYGASPGSSNWNPEADVNGDLIINVLDLAILDKNYGKTV